MKVEDLYKIFLESTGITTDTRKITAGNIFFALSGENFDGNVFARDAIEKGCSYAVVDKAEYVKNERYLLVDDCLLALQDLARYHRDQLTVPFIGITGTNGKTTTKELISKVLSEKYRVVNTEGNLNNHIGVPLTLLKVTRETEIAIIEMGANHPGEIAFLCSIAKPTHGIITNIGKAHLEGFGGFEGVIRTKNELYQYLIDNNGTIFVNSDNQILNNLLSGKRVKKEMYGNSDSSVCSGEIFKSDPYLEFISPGRGLIKTRLAGRYNLENALAAVCIGFYFNVPFENIKNALEIYEPSNQRSQIRQTEHNLLLMDYYNANPSSMEVALENFSRMEHPRKAVILGDMLELGIEAESEHRKVVEKLEEMKVDMTILVGPVFCSLTIPPEIKCFETSGEAKDWLSSDLPEGYLILLKGSRGIKLENIAGIL